MYVCVCVCFSHAHVGFILTVNTTTHSRHCTNRNAGHYCYIRLLHTNLMFCGPCIVIICAVRTNTMHYLLSIYFDKQPLHVLRRFIAYHEEILFSVYTNWYMSFRILLAASQHKCMTYTNCCIYRIVPPDDEQ